MGSWQVQVKVVCGRGLAARDLAGTYSSLSRSGIILCLFLHFYLFLPGWSDPYVKVEQGGTLLHTTEVVPKSLDPDWNEQFSAVITDTTVPLTIKVGSKSLYKLRFPPSGV